VATIHSVRKFVGRMLEKNGIALKLAATVWKPLNSSRTRLPSGYHDSKWRMTGYE